MRAYTAEDQKTAVLHFSRRIVVAVGAMTLLVGGSVAFFSQDGSASPTAAAGSPTLQESAGISSLTGMTLVESGSTPLTFQKGLPESGSSNEETSIGLPQAAAPTGSLNQIFVSSAAIQQLGPVGNGLSLPVPVSFAASNPGPCEVTVRVLEFSSAALAQAAMADPNFTQNPGPGRTPIAHAQIHGGTAVEIQSAANGGLDEIQFQWVQGARWHEVSVNGSALTVAEAQQVANAAAW
jgi:hypothetical protein